MRLVILESPFAGDIERHHEYLQRCIRDCIHRGESPYASHQMLTEALDDRDVLERHHGIEAGYAWWSVASKVIFYTDLGWSLGMAAALRRAQQKSVEIEIRALDGPINHPPEVL